MWYVRECRCQRWSPACARSSPLRMRTNKLSPRCTLSASTSRQAFARGTLRWEEFASHWHAAALSGCRTQLVSTVIVHPVLDMLVDTRSASSIPSRACVGLWTRMSHRQSPHLPPPPQASPLARPVSLRPPLWPPAPLLPRVTAGSLLSSPSRSWRHQKRSPKAVPTARLPCRCAHQTALGMFPVLCRASCFTLESCS